MKTIILMLASFFLIAQTAVAGDPKCDSLSKVLKSLNSKANAYANRYKANIDAHAAETDRIVRGSAGDTTSARNLIGRYEKDTAYFRKCLDTALSIKKAMKETELVFTKACDNVVPMKTFYQIQDQNAKALMYLDGFIDYAESMKKEWTKKLKHTKKEYDGLIEFYRKEEAKRKGSK